MIYYIIFIGKMPDTLDDIIKTVYDNCNDGNYPNALINILKQKHYWPVIKVKKFKNDNNLCLLHNSYKRDDVAEFQDLYDKCRSIVLDFSKSIGNNVVISISSSIPIRASVKDYVDKIYEETDVCYMALDGTLITCYFHNGVWHFGSSSCPDINSSHFSNKDKSHGYMLDEALYELYKNIPISESKDMRKFKDMPKDMKEYYGGGKNKKGKYINSDKYIDVSNHCHFRFVND